MRDIEHFRMKKSQKIPNSFFERGKSSKIFEIVYIFAKSIRNIFKFLRKKISCNVKIMAKRRMTAKQEKQQAVKKAKRVPTKESKFTLL